MKRRFLLTIAMAASLASFGTFAADKPGDQSNDQSSNRGAAPSGSSSSSNGVITAHNGGMSFGQVDKNRDNKLSWAEANMDPPVTERFYQFDQRGTGFIDSSQFNAMGAGPGGGAGGSETPSGSPSGNAGSSK